MHKGEILIYQNSDGNIKIDVKLEEETVWLTQEQMAILFGKARNTITEHIQNVFNEGELNAKVVCREFRHTTQPMPAKSAINWHYKNQHWNMINLKLPGNLSKKNKV